MPKDKLAICVAEFNQALADEELDYQSKLKDIKDQWADAENKWEKAKIDYEADICSAKAKKHKQLLLQR